MGNWDDVVALSKSDSATHDCCHRLLVGAQGVCGAAVVAVKRAILRGALQCYRFTSSALVSLLYPIPAPPLPVPRLLACLPSPTTGFTAFFLFF